MNYEDLIATITASILLLVLLGVCVFFFVKYGIEECKQNKVIREELIKFLKKQNKE